MWLHLLKELIELNPAVAVPVKPAHEQKEVIPLKILKVIVLLHKPLEIRIQNVFGLLRYDARVAPSTVNLPLRLGQS